jgi:hypothetical protein
MKTSIQSKPSITLTHMDSTGYALAGLLRSDSVCSLANGMPSLGDRYDERI